MQKKDIWIKKNYIILLSDSIFFYFNIIWGINRKRNGRVFFLCIINKNYFGKKYNLFSNKGKRYNKRLEKYILKLIFFMN